MRGSQSLFDKLPRRSVSLILLIGVVTSIGLLSLPAADLERPRASDRHITNKVTALLEREHLSDLPLNDDISNRGFDIFVKDLDPMKLYFLESDIQEFGKSKDMLDDWLKEKNIQFAYDVFNRFLQRVDQRVKLVEELLAMQHDFTVDEDMIIKPEVAKWPKDDAEVRDRWRRRVKYDLLVLKSDETEGEEAVEKLKSRYNSYGKRMQQFDGDELLEMYLSAITRSYDPHTTFMSKSTLENFRISLGLKLEGIGAALMSTDGRTKVTKVIQGGAADKHGKLKVEDSIVSVGQGEDGEMVDVIDMKLNDVVQLIRGKAGTIVRLGVISPGENKINTLSITRAKIELKDSEARGVIFDEGKKADGKPYKVGVIDLPSFYMDMRGARLGQPDYKSTTRDMRRILVDFTEKGVDGVILDLRRNGGGSLNEAINCTGLFIDRGPVVQVKGRKGQPQVYDDLERGMVWKGPLVVLTSKFSASASEILAGAIQDYRRGLVVGDEATHGKGTVQSLLELGPQLFHVPDPPNMGALKITMQQFYRPNGDSTQKRGVLADVTLPSISNHMDVGEADLDYSLDFHQVDAAQFKKLNLVNGKLVGELKTRSETRRGQSEDFQKLERKVVRYREQKRQKVVSVNEEKFFARRAELDAEKEDEKAFEEIEGAAAEIVERNFYFNEVMAITVDYLDLLKQNRLAAIGR